MVDKVGWMEGHQRMPILRPEFFCFIFAHPPDPIFLNLMKKEIFLNFIFVFLTDSCSTVLEFNYVFSFCLFYCSQVD